MSFKFGREHCSPNKIPMSIKNFFNVDFKHPITHFCLRSLLEGLVVLKITHSEKGACSRITYKLWNKNAIDGLKKKICIATLYRTL